MCNINQNRCLSPFFFIFNLEKKPKPATIQFGKLKLNPSAYCKHHFLPKSQWRSHSKPPLFCHLKITARNRTWSIRVYTFNSSKSLIKPNESRTQTWLCVGKRVIYHVKWGSAWNINRKTGTVLYNLFLFSSFFFSYGGLVNSMPCF